MDTSVGQAWIWIAIVSALLGLLLASLHGSLDEFSRARLEVRLARAGARGERRLEWLMSRLERIRLAVAVWDMLGMAVFVVALIALLRDGFDDRSGVAAGVGGLVVFALVWLRTGLAWAIAEHAATPVVATALPALTVLEPVARVAIVPMLGLREVVRRLVGAQPQDDLEEELRYVMEESEREGWIDEGEMEMFERLVDFRSRTVDAVMTPRIDVVGVQATDDLEQIKEQIIAAGHSRYPVYSGDLDHIVGILYVKDLLAWLNRPMDDFRLEAILREPMVVPESRRIRDVLEDLQRDKVHLALVLDEYGGTSGMVTLEDIVEEIFGEIRDEHDPDDESEPGIVVHDDGTAEADARLRIDEFNDRLGVNLPEDGDFDTVGGWVFSGLGRIPKEGEEFELDGLGITVMEAERTHLSKLRVVVPEDLGQHHAAVAQRAAANGRRAAAATNGNGNGNGHGHGQGNENGNEDDPGTGPAPSSDDGSGSQSPTPRNP